MIGDRIKQIRDAKKMGLNETAKLAGISGSYLSNIEKGIKSNPSTETLQKIATALGVPVEDFFQKHYIEAFAETNSAIDANIENTIPSKLTLTSNGEEDIEKLNNQSLYKKLALKVKEFREKTQLSREMLAELSGVSLDEITELEDNKKDPAVDTILKLTYTLTVNFSEILNEVSYSENLKPSQKELIEESKNLTDEQIKRITELIKTMK